MEKLVRAFWYVSVMVVFGGLMYSFASLPEEVQFAADYELIDRDSYFYLTLGVVALSNFLLYLIAFRYGRAKSNELLSVTLSGWLYGLNSSINLFYFVSLMYIMMFNSSEKWNYELLGYGIYLAIGVIVVCILSLPFLLLAHTKK